MTDRELLEAAAKAAGFKYVGPPEGRWNPLEDDGDALRLAVKLELEVWNTADDSRAVSLLNDKQAVEPHNGDPYAATRRVIVRAAAAMGEKA